MALDKSGYFGNDLSTSPSRIPGYITNADLATGTDADHDINFPAIICRDASNTKDITTSAYTKQGDVAFAEGTAAGMLADSVTLPASGTIHFFIIEKNSAAGTFDFMADTSASGGTGVSGWTVRRRVGSRITNGSSNILKVIQKGDDHEYDIIISDIADTNPGTAAVTRTLSVPTGIVVGIKMAVNISDATPSDGPTAVLITDLSTTDTTPSTTLSDINIIDIHAGNAAGSGDSSLKVTSNTSGQVRSRCGKSDASVLLSIKTKGFVDRRGRD
jgi:hypothetical protein